MNLAAAAGHLDIVNYLHRIGCPWDNSTATCAAGEGHVDVMDYVLEKRGKWTDQMFMLAAQKGHLNVLEYAYHNRGWSLNRFDRSVYSYWGLSDVDMISDNAIKYGHVHIVEWLISISNRKAGGLMMLRAIRHGNLKVLEFLRDAGVKLDESLWDYAVSYVQLQSIDWLYVNNCPGKHRLRERIDQRGNPQLIEWANSKGL